LELRAGAAAREQNAAACRQQNPRGRFHRLFIAHTRMLARDFSLQDNDENQKPLVILPPQLKALYRFYA
jgi:hypothetical protein